MAYFNLTVPGRLLAKEICNNNTVFSQDRFCVFNVKGTQHRLRSLLIRRYYEYFASLHPLRKEIRADVTVLSLLHVYVPTIRKLRVCLIGDLYIQALLTILLSGENHHIRIFTEYLTATDLSILSDVKQFFSHRIIEVFQGSQFETIDKVNIFCDGMILCKSLLIILIMLCQLQDPLIN